MKRFRAEDLGLPRTEIECLIDEWVFHEIHRSILKRRLLDGLTMEQLAEEFELSVERTKEIIYNAQQQLTRHLKFPP